MMHRPRKRFGQHFLCDQGIIQHIVSTLSPEANQHLIEIGPGSGALTTPILKKIKQLEVIELDRDLIGELEERYRQYPDLTIHSADVLEFDFSAIKKDERLLRVFGNLPYNISTPLIFHLLTYASIIDDMLFMLQKEVAERMAAPADTKNYGRLSVMVQYYCRVELLFDVPPSAFSPPPKVQSSIVRLIPYTEPPYFTTNFNLFTALVKQAFGQRRKTLRNSLKTLIDTETWSRLAIDSHLRAENLSVKDFVDISNAMTEKE
jgi:16S rRNA (adenine1518-N6/adenine1519-N6)-dimethyltransferase